MSDYTHSQLEAYLNSLVPERPAEMQRMEQYAQQVNFPIVGPASGQFCYLIARLINARRVFEMGSGYGYSTAWFARAVQENGVQENGAPDGQSNRKGEVYHVVWKEELSQRARQHLQSLGLGDLIQYRVAEAVQTLQETDGPFDIIFNDIDKNGYPRSLPIIEEKLRPGGVLIVDNLIWHGQILDPSDHEPDTESIREFTRLITTSPRWITSLVPIRDGLMVAMKK